MNYHNVAVELPEYYYQIIDIFQIYWWIFILSNIKNWSDVKKNYLEIKDIFQSSSILSSFSMRMHLTLAAPLSEKNGFIVF